MRGRGGRRRIYIEHEQCHDRVIDHRDKRREFVEEFLTLEIRQANPRMRASRFDTGCSQVDSSPSVRRDRQTTNEEFRLKINFATPTKKRPERYETVRAFG
jgi:hypothetical protein